ncbi:hypothetical protein ACP70R_044502 [Stipagrostis hirtigluma subsp. patula]
MPPMEGVNVKAAHRGHFTCFHGNEAPPATDLDLQDNRAVVEPMLDMYVEAVRRLPLAEMPGLLECVRDGGHCVGLLDPVGNIILNVVDLFRRRYGCGDGEAAGTATKRIRTRYCCALPSVDRDTYFLVAIRSHDGLVAFMHSYFRYLTDAQATRYLRLAGHDLALAVLLVEHERHHARPRDAAGGPDPGCARTRAALRLAARKARHPEPGELARLMASRFPLEPLISVLLELRTGRRLTVDGVRSVVNLLELRPPPPVADIHLHVPSERHHLLPSQRRALLQDSP